jgi:hypothetical protein
MTAKKIPTRRPAEIERDRRNIASLYLKGKIQAEIAFELGISQPTVSREIKTLVDEWKQERVYDINEAKAKELAKLDVLELEYWNAWLRSQNDEVSRTEGTTARGEVDTTTTKGQTGDSAFLQGVERCIKLRLEILGMVISKFELTGKDGEPLNPKENDDGFNRSIASFADAVREKLFREDPKQNRKVGPPK